MIKLIKDIIFAWKFKRAVKKANKLSRLFGMKYLVIFLNGRSGNWYAHTGSEKA